MTRCPFRVLSIHYSLMQLKLRSNCQIFNCHITNIYRTAQDKLAPFGYKQMPGQKTVIEMGTRKTPTPIPTPIRSLSYENVTCDVSLGVVGRNTGSSLSSTRPWGNKRMVRRYLPDSTKEAPKHELIKSTGYFKLQIPKEISSPLNLQPSSQRLSPVCRQPRLQRNPFPFQRSHCRSPGARGHARGSERTGGGLATFRPSPKSSGFYSIPAKIQVMHIIYGGARSSPEIHSQG